MLACDEAQKPVKHGTDEPPVVTRCQRDDECASGERCLQSLCVLVPPPTDPDVVPSTAHLRATPLSLGFGAVALGTTQRLAVVLENDGGEMLTLDEVRITPSDLGFRVAPLGTGPFWIRPGRSREIFVDFTPTQSGSRSAELLVRGRGVEIVVMLQGN